MKDENDNTCIMQEMVDKYGLSADLSEIFAITAFKYIQQTYTSIIDDLIDTLEMDGELSDDQVEKINNMTAESLKILSGFVSASNFLLKRKTNKTIN